MSTAYQPFQFVFRSRQSSVLRFSSPPSTTDNHLSREFTLLFLGLTRREDREGISKSAFPLSFVVLGRLSFLLARGARYAMRKGNRCHVSREQKEEIARLSLDPTLKIKDIAEAVGVSHQTVNRTLNKCRDKGLEVREHNGYGRPSALRHAELDYLEQRHKEEPTVDLHVLQQELWDKFNIEVHPSTINRHRLKLGLVQVDPERLRIQEEREEQRRAEALQKLAERKLSFAEVDKERRNAFLSRVRGYNPRALVFIDEISFSDASVPLIIRETGPAASEREWTNAHKRRHTVYLALTVNGLLDVSIASSRTPASRAVFLTRTTAYLRPYPSPQSVLVTTSSALYSGGGLREAVEARGAKLLHIPRYAYDLNPLAAAARLVQKWACGRRRPLKTRGTQIEPHQWVTIDWGMSDRVDVDADADNPMEELFDELCQITPELAQLWLMECGYNLHM